MNTTLPPAFTIETCRQAIERIPSVGGDGPIHSLRIVIIGDYD